MCVKSADLTAHSPPKTFARPRTATRPSRALPLAHAAPTHALRLRDAFPADLTTHSPPKAFARPEHFLTPFPSTSALPHATPTHARTATRPSRALPLPHAAPTHARRLRDTFLAAPTTHSPPKAFSRPRTATRPSPALLPHPRSPDARPQAAQRPHRKPAPAPPRSATLPPPLFRFGHKKTAPHSACAMPNVSVDRRCGRSFGWVSRALFAAVAGRWRVGVGLRPQPWALRSRRCGRVLRA